MTNWEAALICSLHLINTAYLCKPHVLSAEDGEKMWPCACLLVYLLFRINASMATFNTINTVPIMSVAKFVVSFPERVTFATVSTNRDIWRMVNDYLQLCFVFLSVGLDISQSIDRFWRWGLRMMSGTCLTFRFCYISKPVLRYHFRIYFGMNWKKFRWRY